MKKSLKAIVVPALRKAGFSGSFPHFRRMGPDHTDLMTFQFDRHGGGFLFEIAQCPSSGFTTLWGKFIPSDNVTAHNLNPRDRQRIKREEQPGTEGWFRFEDEAYEKVAYAVLPYLDKAELWWKERKADR